MRGLLETLVSTFGPGAKLTDDDISPYLGDEGALAPWALTDAIDKGDIPVALDRLHRMMGAGERHALQIMSSLHGHYTRMLALDGIDVRGEKDAAAALGMRGSTFPARKALDQCRRLGHDKLAQAIALLARADRDLRGRAGLPARGGRRPGDGATDRPAGESQPVGPLSRRRGLVDPLLQAGLAAGGGVLVDDALGGGLVEALDGGLRGVGRRSRRPARRR